MGMCHMLWLCGAVCRAACPVRSHVPFPLLGAHTRACAGVHPSIVPHACVLWPCGGVRSGAVCRGACSAGGGCPCTYARTTHTTYACMCACTHARCTCAVCCVLCAACRALCHMLCCVPRAVSSAVPCAMPFVVSRPVCIHSHLCWASSSLLISKWPGKIPLQVV